MKYITHISGLVLIAGIAGIALAQENVLIVDTLTNIPELTSEGSANNLPDFLQNLYRYGIGIAAVLAVVMITYGGFQYMMSEVPGARTAKRQQIVQAIFGLILVLLPFIVFSIINPQILDLDPGFERAASERRDVNFGNGNGPYDAYTRFQRVNIRVELDVNTSNQSCSDVLEEDAWVQVPDGLCPNTGSETEPADGYISVCCGFNPSLVREEPDPRGDFILGFEYKVENFDFRGNDCRDYEERDFESLESCSEYVDATPGIAVTQNCDGTVSNPPAPEEFWNTIKDLEVCEI